MCVQFATTQSVVVFYSIFKKMFIKTLKTCFHGNKVVITEKVLFCILALNIHGVRKQNNRRHFARKEEGKKKAKLEFMMQPLTTLTLGCRKSLWPLARSLEEFSHLVGMR